MVKVKAFFYIYLKSLTSPDYYRELLKTDIKFSLKYFLVLGLVGAIASTIVISLRTIPEMNTGIRAIFNQADTLYPEDLVINIENSEWSINKAEPYTIPFPSDMQENMNADGDTEENFPANFVTFYKDGTIGDLENYDTLILINAKNVLIKDSAGVETVPIKDLPNNQVDKAKFMEMMNTVKFFAMFFPYLVTFVVLAALLIANLILGVFYVLIISGLLWLLGQFLSEKYAFKDILRIGVHTLSWVVTLQFLISLANLVIYLFKFDHSVGLEPIYYFLINLVFGAFILVHLNRPAKKK